MSSALESAKKKRAMPEPVRQNTKTPNFGSNEVQTVNPTPITLAQAVALLNNRVGMVENKIKTIIETNATTTTQQQQQPQPVLENNEEKVLPNSVMETLAEYDDRFNILAEEIANLKNIVLSLQTYTMDVNKMLIEERIRLLSSTDGITSSVIGVDSTGVEKIDLNV